MSRWDGQAMDEKKPMEVEKRHWVHAGQHINLVGSSESAGYVVSWRDGDRTEHDSLLEAKQWIDRNVAIKNWRLMTMKKERDNNGDS